jgi:hypothetical protein
MRIAEKLRSVAFDFASRLDLLDKSFFFLQRHFLVILSLALVAAFGRVLQLGGFGEISPLLNFFMEILVEGSRVAIFLLVLGIERFRKAWLVIRSWSELTEISRRALTIVRHEWVRIVFNAFGFLLIAGLLNFTIDQLAYETCLLLSLKQEGILVPASSEWTVLLFFKNILVIPFTIVFETVMLLWLFRQRLHF